MKLNNTTAVIFIPDIYGFSEFVNDIEILHGQEIDGIGKVMFNYIKIDLPN